MKSSLNDSIFKLDTIDSMVASNKLDNYGGFFKALLPFACEYFSEFIALGREHASRKGQGATDYSIIRHIDADYKGLPY